MTEPRKARILSICLKCFKANRVEIYAPMTLKEIDDLGVCQCDR